MERWAREVWIMHHRVGGGFPQEALLEGELGWAHEIATAQSKKEMCLAAAQGSDVCA